MYTHVRVRVRVCFFSFCAAGSPPKGTAAGGIGDSEAESTFLEIQRALLSRLEAVYVTMADDRSGAVVG